MNRLPRIIVAASLLLAAVPGCRRELWYDYGGIAQAVAQPDWKRSGGTPRGCETFVYCGDRLYTTVLSKDISHVEVLLPEGEYTFLTFTYSESEYGTLRFTGKDRLSTIGVRSADVFSTKDSDIAPEPEWIGAGISAPFSVSAQDVSGSLVPYRDWSRRSSEGKAYDWIPVTAAVVDVPVKNLVSELRTAVHVRGAERVLMLSMRVEGLSDGWDIAAGRPSSSTSVRVVNSWTRSKSKAPGEGVFNSSAQTFGLPEGASSLPAVSLEFVLTDGETVVREDVGEVKIERVRDDETYEWRTVIDIVIGSEDDPIILPESTGGQGTGTDAWVDRWEDGGEMIIPV